MNDQIPDQCRKSWIHSLFQSVFGGGPGKAANHCRPVVRPELEQLEDRQLLSGASAAIAQGLTHSAENYSNIVAGIYDQYLNRTPDASGLNYWVGRMQAGMPDDRLEASVLSSAEYIHSHGGTNSGWVQGMYNDLMGRSPDIAGLNYWVNKLNTGTQASEVAFGFTASRERESQRVTQDYIRFLGRLPDQAGLDHWINRLTQGYSNEDLVAGFVGSDEYLAHNGGGDLRQFINQAYNDVLYRDPGMQEIDSWLPPQAIQAALPTTNSPSTASTGGSETVSSASGSGANFSSNTSTGSAFTPETDNSSTSVYNQLLAALLIGSSGSQVGGNGYVYDPWPSQTNSLLNFGWADNPSITGGGSLWSMTDNLNWVNNLLGRY